jgi:fructokinase
VRLFDVNLRQDYYSPGVLDASLRRATMVKLNDGELPRVVGLLGLRSEEDEGEEAVARRLLQAHDLALVCVTRGAGGSLLVTEADAVAHPGYRVRVADTVGSGDAFAAAMAHHWLRGAPLAAVSDAANRLGAYVATQVGATPLLSPDVRRQVLHCNSPESRRRSK